MMKKNNSVIDLLEKEKRGDNKNTVITIRLSNTVIKELDELKKEIGTSRSKLISMLVQSGLDQMNENKKK